MREGLSKSWLDIVLGSADRISHYVNPDVRVENDHMDIRKYVKFKKVIDFIYHVIHFLHANYSLHLILFLTVVEREKGGLKCLTLVNPIFFSSRLMIHFCLS